MKPPGQPSRGWRALTLAAARDVVPNSAATFAANGPCPEIELGIGRASRGGWLEVRMVVKSQPAAACYLRMDREEAAASREIRPLSGGASMLFEVGPHPFRLHLVMPPGVESVEVLSAVYRRRSGPEQFVRSAREASPGASLPALTTLAGLWRKGGARAAMQAVVSGRLDADEETVYQMLVGRDAPQFPATPSGHGPLISVLMPVYNPDPRWLDEAIESVIAQRHEHWELCIADDASDRTGVKECLQTWSRRDSRVRVVHRSERGHICAASNSALELVRGEYVALLDHDDRLHPDALAEVVRVLAGGATPDVVYTDEDHLDAGGRRCRPVLKPDWSRDLLLSHMYMCHLGVYRTARVREVGGFRAGFEGAQDHDLALRVTEGGAQVVHIPRVLYHWRESDTSTAAQPGRKGYAREAGLRAVREAIARRGEHARIEPEPRHAGCFVQRWIPPAGATATVVIPTKDRSDLLSRCLESVFANAGAVSFDVVVVSNNSAERATFALLEGWRQREPSRFAWFEANEPFNYSRLNNLAAARSSASVLAFLNNDIEARQKGWLDDLVGCALRSETGAIGPMLLYPDHRIQHAGVIVGIGAGAAHAFRGLPADSPGRGYRLLGASNFSAVTGACLAVSRQRFRAVGGFDESLPYWFNDVDLCLRLGALGLWNVLLPQVRLVHHESSSLGSGLSPGQQVRFGEALAVMRERWPAAFSRDPFHGALLSRSHEDFRLAWPGPG